MYMIGINLLINMLNGGYLNRYKGVKKIMMIFFTPLYFNYGKNSMLIGFE